MILNFSVLESLQKESMGENGRNAYNIIPVSKMGRKESLGLILEVNQPFLDLFPSNSFQMYTFKPQELFSVDVMPFNLKKDKRK